MIGTQRDIDILVSEVGPRDGLQSIGNIMPLADKKAWIDAEVSAGAREIEVGSFVPAKLLPQLADTAELVAHALTLPGLTVAVLVPNLQGARAAVRAGAHKITIPFSASETHSLKNVRRTHLQMLEEVRAVATMLREQPVAGRPRFEGGMSTAFGCTYEGAVPADKVVRLAEALMTAGCDEVGLSDSVGYANPQQVKQLVSRVRSTIGAQAFAGLHLHNTRGLGLANVVAGLEVGVTTFDSSLAGLGGCPFAPGATGNIVTEDLVFMLESMGLRTGIDLYKLLGVRKILRAALPDDELYGYVPAAGLPLDYISASSADAAVPHRPAVA
ncbi:MAG: hydroxymethylglutaryl-CoA lyase [Gammaproteobacteria bacterium]|nr:hydroxymethylglutaryl-CoA lyase [Gammaproteobacteria bacterium]MDE2251853.1 hydroxymethylglutaryl-CoA lyase [Gammaproteobacteria bacterium]